MATCRDNLENWLLPGGFMDGRDEYIYEMNTCLCNRILAGHRHESISCKSKPNLPQIDSWLNYRKYIGILAKQGKKQKVRQ